MVITVAKDEIVLKHQRSNPEVVDGYRRSLAPQLAEYSGVMVRSLIVRKQDGYSRFHQEAAQNAFVLRTTGPVDETGA